MSGNKNANLDLIRERLNILDVVSTYIKLDKAGSQFRARCPFHSEKSPSFYVSPSRGSYHCFGCAEHGDIFGFVMKIEGINFKDALRLLADRAGVSLSNFKKEETSSLIDILEQTTLFFEHSFSENAKEVNNAKKYLQKRGVSDETIQKFRIGFAPNDWRQLYTKLNKAGYSDEEIVSSGVCIRHEKGLYDRFRNRIMFPIMNSSGKVVAYSGRVLPDSTPIGQIGSFTEPAKYVNSPETPMYHKSSILFGYNFAKQEIARQKKVLVVEGQMDVVMAHQAGNINTVAISGTAFTVEHVSILKRFADTVVLALDSDKAGYAAMLKSAALALENDLEVEGIKLAEKDPADMIVHDLDNWKKVVADTRPILTLITEIILEKEKVKPKQIQLLRKDLFPLLRVVKSPLLKETYIKEIAKLLDIDEKIIKQETENVRSEFEMQIANTKKEKKLIPKKDILTIFAKAKIALEILEQKFPKGNEALIEKYNKEFTKVKLLELEIVLVDIPENILDREHILIEQMLEEDAVVNIKNLTELINLGLKSVYEEAINQIKEKIRKGENLEENLVKIQELTKAFSNI
jgi:DNA primase